MDPRSTVQNDRQSGAKVRASSERIVGPVDVARNILSLFVAMTGSRDLFRAAVEYVATITPVQDILARPEIVAGIRNTHAAMKGPPPPMPGPTRGQLLDMFR